MTCSTIKLPSVGMAIICERGRRRRRCAFAGCERPAEVQCDFPVPGRASRTCDRYLCKPHARHVGPDRDYCRHHQEEMAL
jgi:hypothetical protein